MLCKINYDFISSICLILTLLFQIYFFVTNFNNTRKSESVKNILQLNEYFNNNKLWNVFSKFQNGDYINKNLRDFSDEEKFEVFEYLELFELAYEMYKTKHIDKEIFFKKFSYRISNFQDAPIVQTLIKEEPWEWDTLIKLIFENEEYAISNQQRFD